MRRALALGLAAWSVSVLFWRLDGNHLWRDEATTAVWARQMAETGSWLPWVYDARKGQLTVQAADGHDVNSRLLPAMQSYLQFYVAAASFRLFGVSERSARAPFALVGLGVLFVLYLVGRELFGGGAWALAPPGLAATSIFFLNAARQCRYYPLLLLGATWLILEVCRYLRAPESAAQRGLYVRIGAAGALIYLSNYVSFVAVWASLGVFALLNGDRRFLKGLAALSAALAPAMLVEFFALHAEFAGQWPPRAPQPWHEVYQIALVRRLRDLWRAIPLVLLVPAVVALAWRRLPAAAKILAIPAAGLPLAGLAVDAQAFLDMSPAAFWTLGAVALSLPAFLYLLWRSTPEPGPQGRIALFCALVFFLSPAITIAAGKDRTSTRHYYQVLPAAVLLASLAAAAHFRQRRSAGLAALAAFAVWPNIDSMMGGMDEVVQRQFLRDTSYLGPALEFLRDNVPAGSRVAFLRNVQGMAVYFYRPDLRWVGLLDSDAPHNRKFRGRIPDDQFDDAADADWYVIWDPRGETAKGLDPTHYRLVHEYSHPMRLGWWDRNLAPPVRKYEFWKRDPAETAR